MLTDLIVFLIWCGSLTYNPHLFKIIWAVPYLLGWRSPLINVLLQWPQEPSSLNRKASQDGSFRITGEINIVRMEIIQLIYYILGFWSSYCLAGQTDFLCWEVGSVLVEIFLDWLGFLDQTIVKIKLYLLLISGAVLIFSHPILIPIQIFLTLTTRYPLCYGQFIRTT